ncbi:DNA-binding PucR family transcriptional regulator/GAF domain-containing protein [Oikeobacillus pervagus]|uniref:DNA-binding PucR family transcriptional regulator/GAF domain-containing protein n=1 Tax=Oikeobacillus pervagus TaxID=1325931 RepID=A0AAJ1WIR7_9BACI|nr:helix-turn-helix domain-containing protein [Oikeobacillus pervagus]MDQ0214935.1 DNA-binding PucR family transcriptional regulator/GAF domain-containing protein [Oikeobacillus pervagus]
MRNLSKRDRLVEKLESHLRYSARHLIKFDSLEETLQYIINSFWVELPCDLVAIILKEKDVLKPKVWKGGSDQFEKGFPIPLNRCSTNILEEGWSIEKTREGIQCDFHKLMTEENISTWFTVPLKEDITSIGFCVVGFQNFVPLIAETERIFVEFGKDIAVSIKLAQNKEIEKKKMEGLTWFNDNLYPGSPIEPLVGKVVEMACMATGAASAYIYLYDQRQNCFSFQPPHKGVVDVPNKIWVGNHYNLSEHFPFFERVGENELTVPLVVNLETIGILHLADKRSGVFKEEDIELLEFFTTHVATLLENARLYEIEIDLKHRLETVIEHQQELVKQTLDGEGFDAISHTLGHLVKHPIILFDRFFRPVSYYKLEMEEGIFQDLINQVQNHREHVKEMKKRKVWLNDLTGENDGIGIWPVVGGGDLLGYLAIRMKKDQVDDVLRLTIEHALNVYAIQFIKQKLVMDTKEQVKDSFINKLFEETIEDEDQLIEYANLFNWNLFAPHRIGILSIQLADQKMNLLDLEAQKTAIWEQVKEFLTLHDPDIIFTRRGDDFILIVPESKAEKGMKAYWQSLYKYICQLNLQGGDVQKIFLGVGGKTEKLRDYYFCYKQAHHARNVVIHHLQDEGFALFEDLGAYTLLNNLKDPLIANLFIETYLEPLLHYKDGKGADLFTTLRVYIYNNGNWKKTMESLFIHRSTLRYRMERIRDILEIDIDHAENRLNLMMAYKLYDLYYSH